MDDTASYDVAIIGGGSAGYAAARTAAAEGLRTVVIEGGKEVGGLCILRGCMPSKALLHTTEVLHQVRMGKVFGLQTSKIGFDFGGVMARKKKLIKEFAQYRCHQLNEGDFAFYRAKASFLDSHKVALHKPRGPAPKTIRARHFVICTGSATAPPPVSSLNDVGYLTSDEALSLRKLPRSLIILGGGPVAVELAQFFCRLDVKVTLIQRGEHLLRDFDTDAAEILERVLQRERLKMWRITGLIGAGAFRRGGQKVVEFTQGGRKRRVAAEEILVAVGREPATEGLDLEKAGVKLDGRRIITDSGMRTNVPHIFAAGDCTGPYQIVHVGIEQGEVAAHNIAHPRHQKAMDYRLLTSVVFTEPQVACVGLTEKEAQRQGVLYLAASYPFADHGKAIIMEARDGFVKLLADPHCGEILGGGCVGPLAGELIHEIIAAMRGRLTVEDLAAMPHYHPTLAEIWTYPAAELAARVRGARASIGIISKDAVTPAEMTRKRQGNC
jgi:pyruvate/2-oxoglutarate dehydrogenase complex dihydrolipoamide dehydrogenase (E3) component